MKNNETITCIVSNYNRGNQLANSLLSLREAGANNIIVADDGSTDNPEIISQKYSAKFLSQNHQYFGLGRMRNLAAKLAKTKYLLILDSDMIASRDLFSVWTSVVKNLRDRDIKYVFNGRTVSLYYPSKRSKISGFTGVDPRDIPFRKKYRAFDKRFIEPHILTPELCHLFCGGHIFISREAYWTIGGFDENLKRYGEEDWDFALMALKRGLGLAFIREALVYHIPHFRNELSNNFSIAENRKYIIKKHHLSSDYGYHR